MNNEQPSEEVIDEASEESFPASDPPAPSSPTEDRGPGSASDEGAQDDPQEDRQDGTPAEQRPPSDS